MKHPGEGGRVATATGEGPAEPAGLGEDEDDVVGTKGQSEARRVESRKTKFLIMERQQIINLR